MFEKDKEINNLIMEKIGLEVRDHRRVYDQDTGLPIQINGKDVVSPGSISSKTTVEFDPFNNPRMMNNLFGYYADKLRSEDEVDIEAFYTVDEDSKTFTSKVECKDVDNVTYTSQAYKRDTLKYLDVIMQLNGEDPGRSLYQYDYPKQKVDSSVKKKTTTKPRKGVKKNDSKGN